MAVPRIDRATAGDHDSAASIDVSWFWNAVPAAGRDIAEVAAWKAQVSALLDEWVGDKVAAARAAWPADADEEFPFAIDELGPTVTDSLLARADHMPAHARLFWGAGFLRGDLRWMPVLVLAEFCRPRADDPAYLMAEVGVDGLAEDVREPTVDYVTTDHGDGLRVFALAQSAREGTYGRVDAALRLEVPGTGAGPVPDVDVLLRTRVFGLDQMAVIGSGVETLMHMIAADAADQPDGGPAPMQFATERSPS
ncbi:hypothetical protein [Mangrovihabitans endophyticus]|uniref:Uncharacterized protein n=1 Tax=Mangrovihabitans endophyticus TaxID=1751298 RepID=A0A8J3BZ32_9ACTN|nr:hypothetical protein [Mangrovihabitans endophyticus]GGK95867.1 hypothetical protein GCM10012284_32540 [Mangrovihabitans endophyticus]